MGGVFGTRMSAEEELAIRQRRMSYRLKINSYVQKIGHESYNEVKEWVDKTYSENFYTEEKTLNKPIRIIRSKEELFDSFELAFAMKWEFSVVEFGSALPKDLHSISWKLKQNIKNGTFFYDVVSYFDSTTGLWLRSTYNRYYN